MFMKFNPYNISCLYKKRIESQALSALSKCEDDFKVLADSGDDSLVAPPADDRRFNIPEEEEVWDAAGPVLHGCRTSSADGASFVDRLLDSIKLESKTWEKQNNGLSPWKTCRFCHMARLSQKFVEQLRLDSTNRSTSAKRTGSGQSALDSGGSGSSVGIKSTSTSGRSSPTRHAKSAEYQKHPSLEGVKSQKKSKDKQHHPAITAYPAFLDNCNDYYGEIHYPFKHNMTRSYYIKCYREHFTDRNTPGTFYNPYARESKPTPKATLQCSDVRNGACIKPVLVKASNFNFKVCRRYRVPSSNVTGRQKSTPSASPCSSPTCCKSSKCADADGSNTPPTSAHSRSHQQKGHSGPMVSRSRPSIPSNARGIICATSIETPAHVVTCVRGKSFSEDNHRHHSGGTRRHQTQPSPHSHGTSPAGHGNW